MSTSVTRDVYAPGRQAALPRHVVLVVPRRAEARAARPGEEEAEEEAAGYDDDDRRRRRRRRLNRRNSVPEPVRHARRRERRPRRRTRARCSPRPSARRRRARSRTRSGTARRARRRSACARESRSSNCAGVDVAAVRLEHERLDARGRGAPDSRLRSSRRYSTRATSNQTRYDALCAIPCASVSAKRTRTSVENVKPSIGAVFTR